jgi:hypothetical protein
MRHEQYVRRTIKYILLCPRNQSRQSFFHHEVMSIIVWHYFIEGFNPALSAKVIWSVLRFAVLPVFRVPPVVNIKTKKHQIEKKNEPRVLSVEDAHNYVSLNHDVPWREIPVSEYDPVCIAHHLADSSREGVRGKGPWACLTRKSLSSDSFLNGPNSAVHVGLHAVPAPGTAVVSTGIGRANPSRLRPVGRSQKFLAERDG